MKCIYLKPNKEFDTSKDSFDIKSFKHCDYTELLKSLVFLRNKILEDFEYQIEVINSFCFSMLYINFAAECYTKE